MPRLSVIVPARRCAAQLERSLSALAASDLPRDTFEIIVVDDDSGDDTPVVAGRGADRVVRLEGGPRGPGGARNEGAAVAGGELLAFVDADVCVHADALRRLCAAMDAEADIGAVFGAYDTSPPAPGIVSQYRNLVHHWVHVRNAGDAETFWAGCGAVRAAAFRAVGGFDARRYPRPQIEDIELGHRLRDAGWRILLDPAIRGTHLKAWTLAGGILTDVRDRGIPWMRLLRDERRSARTRTLNLRLPERLATIATGLASLTPIAAAVSRDVRWIAVGGVLAGLALLPSLPVLAWLARLRGLPFALAAVPLRLLYYLGNGVSVAAALLPEQTAPASMSTES